MSVQHLLNYVYMCGRVVVCLCMTTNIPEEFGHFWWSVINRNRYTSHAYTHPVLHQTHVTRHMSHIYTHPVLHQPECSMQKSQQNEKSRLCRPTLTLFSSPFWSCSGSKMCFRREKKLINLPFGKGPQILQDKTPLTCSVIHFQPILIPWPVPHFYTETLAGLHDLYFICQISFPDHRQGLW